jgi:hypothetical protein
MDRGILAWNIPSKGDCGKIFLKNAGKDYPILRYGCHE